MRPATTTARLVAAVLFLAVPCLADPQEIDAAPGTTAAAYQAVLGRLSGQGRLDDDGEMLDRVRAAFGRLVPAATAKNPQARNWAWELHVTSDPSVAAFCMAGGKMLVGAGFVRRLNLDDDELAMLLAHEMAHALAGHRRERAPAGGMEEDAAWQNREAAIAFAQEREADHLGLAIAHDAGFPLAGLLGFFDKLSAAEPAGTFSSTHPPAARRSEQAHAWAAELRSPPK